MQRSLSFTRAARRLFIALLLTGLPVTALAAPFTALYGFGDSLSDTGNVYAATGGAVPPAPYYQGRFSNGPVAIEGLAADLGLSAVASSLGGTNFAYGGARTGSGGSVPGLLDQVGLFGLTLGGPADADALYFVFAGGNDLRDAAVNPANATTIVQQGVANINTALTLLYGLGARDFFVPNLPNIGRTPEAISGGVAAGATFLSLMFNQLLAANLQAFQLLHPDAFVYQFNTYLLFETIIGNAAALGYTNTTAACISTPGCDPNAFVFWDGVHPTAKTHDLFADAMASTIPEPATIGLFTLGLGAIAASRRRRAL